MKKDKLHISEEDKLIEDFFTSYETEKPSKEFTKGTMDQVLQEWSSNPITTSNKMSLSNKVWIGVAVAFSFVLVYLIDFRDVSESTSVTNMFKVDLLQQTFNTTLDSFGQVPALIYISIFGLVGLLFFDKLLHKLLT